MFRVDIMVLINLELVARATTNLTVKLTAKIGEILAKYGVAKQEEGRGPPGRGTAPGRRVIAACIPIRTGARANTISLAQLLDKIPNLRRGPFSTICETTCSGPRVAGFHGDCLILRPGS